MSEEFAAATISEVAPLLRERKVSPVELTLWHLDRVAKLNARLNAFITVLGDQAMAQAREAEAEIARGDYRGPLHGIPVAIKDIIAIAGVRMTCGSRILADHISARDATVVARLRAAGAILLGTLHLHEFAWGGTSINPHYGNARNPWNLDCIAGGSSGGSAIAVATSMAMATLGTDTGGSVRIPSALCGTTGLKPTYGRVSRDGVFPLCNSLDHVGVLTRSAQDAALMLNAIAGADPRDPSSAGSPVPDYSRELNANIRKLRVGQLRGFFAEDIQDEIESGLESAVQALRGLDAQVDEVTLPLMKHMPGASLAIMTAESYAVHERMIRERAQDYGVDVRLRLMMGAMVSAPQYLKAQRFRTLLCEQTAEAMRRFDLLVAPTTAITATPATQESVRVGSKDLVVAASLSRLTRPANMTGLPAIALPSGFSREGLPVSFQIIGRPFDEATVLRAAHAYQSATDWHRRRPAE
ncbi:MAG TPA: amidase [Candidatus Binataceae bacterium]|nr:amidase [Candidatus Binataceae bacterium]